MNLLPALYWNYDLIDAIRELRVALSSGYAHTQSRIHIPGLGSCLPVRSARSAIVIALKALSLPQGAFIGVPLYCCAVVFKAIKEAGYNPRFIDVDPDTYCMSVNDLKNKSSEVKAVIAVHMFGNLCDIPQLQEVISGRPIIEDCAQALGSRFGGKLAGSFGQIAVFSFRSGKYLSVGEGGALYSGDASLEAKMSELTAGFSRPSPLEELVHVATTYLRSALRSRPLWGLIGARLWDSYNERISYASKSPLVMGQAYETDRDMVVRRLPFLASWIEKQRSYANYYAQNLTVDADMLCSETLGNYYNRLQYPMLIPTSELCDKLAACLRDNQITTSRPYKDIAEIAKTYYGYTGDCSCAERIAKTVLAIPCNHALKAADVERIVSCVNRAWAQFKGWH